MGNPPENPAKPVKGQIYAKNSNNVLCLKTIFWLLLCGNHDIRVAGRMALERFNFNLGMNPIETACYAVLHEFS